MKVYRVQMGDGRYKAGEATIKVFYVAAETVISASELAGNLWIKNSLGEAEYPLNYMRVDEESPLDGIYGVQVL